MNGDHLTINDLVLKLKKVQKIAGNLKVWFVDPKSGKLTNKPRVSQLSPDEISIEGWEVLDGGETEKEV